MLVLLVLVTPQCVVRHSSYRDPRSLKQLDADLMSDILICEVVFEALRLPCTGVYLRQPLQSAWNHETELCHYWHLPCRRIDDTRYRI